MFKLTIPCRIVNFSRYLVFRLIHGEKYSEYDVISKKLLTIKTSQFHSNQRNNSSDSRIRHFYEYPDENANQDDTQTPYKKWKENGYAHSIMEKNELYSETIVLIPNTNSEENTEISENELEDLLEKNFRLETISNLVNNFRTISHHAKKNNSNVYDEKYENIINSIANHSTVLTDDEICHVLKSLMLWFVEFYVDDTSFSLLCNALDSECKSRAKFWSVQKVLFVSDHWYRLRLTARSKFMLDVIVTLGKNPALLSSRNLVQLMFYASVSRTSLVNYREVESQLKSNIQHLDINEVAIVALGFFKTQTVIRDRTLLTMIIQETIKQIHDINDISLAAVLKVVRYSIHMNDLDFLCKLLENTIPQIPRLSVTCLVHIILAAANRGLFYAELLNAVAARFYREISKVRIKDIRCLIFALSSFNYVPVQQPNIFERVVEELNETKREEEKKAYPKCFVACLHHLSILNIHPRNLIAQALNPESVRKAYGSDVNKIRREIFALDLAIETEIPDYRGPRLDTRTREDVAMRLTNPAPRESASQLTMADHLMLDVIRSCEEYLGSREMIHVDHILPQYAKPDIIICFDETNSPIPISSMLSKLPFGTVKHPPKISSDDGIKWIVLVIGNGNSYARNTERILGHICAKHRQLQYIGYKPFIIFWKDWRQLRTDAEKIRYLQCKVFY